MTKATTSKPPQVSICIPTYNGSAYLQEALNAASAQTYKDVEILVVDDGSHDDTVEVARRHSRQDPRVIVVQNPRNMGLVGNWNRCIEIAQGEWIKFLFQDDTLEPDCVAKLLRLAESGCLFVACGRNFIIGEGAPKTLTERVLAMPKIAELLNEGCYGASDYLKVQIKHLGHNIIGEPTCVMFHRSVPEKYGSFDKDLKHICDYEYWLRVCSNEGVGVQPENLATFRMHGTSTTSANASEAVDVIGIDWLFLVDKMLRNKTFRNFSVRLDFRLACGSIATKTIMRGANRGLDLNDERLAELMRRSGLYRILHYVFRSKLFWKLRSLKKILLRR